MYIVGESILVIIVSKRCVSGRKARPCDHTAGSEQESMRASRWKTGNNTWHEDRALKSASFSILSPVQTPIDEHVDTEAPMSVSMHDLLIH